MIDVGLYKRLKAKGRTQFTKDGDTIFLTVTKFNEDGDLRSPETVPIDLAGFRRLEDDLQKMLRNVREFIADAEAIQAGE